MCAAGHSSLQVIERDMSVAGDQIEEAIASLDDLDPGEGPYESRVESNEEKVLSFLWGRLIATSTARIGPCARRRPRQ